MPNRRSRASKALSAWLAVVHPLSVAFCGALSLLLFSGVEPAAAQSTVRSNQVVDPSHPELLEESLFLKIPRSKGDYRLEAIVVRPAKAQGRLPVALLTHGKPRSASEMALVRPETLVRQARDLAYRGYLAVGVVRRGYGRSDGTPGVATNAAYVKCNTADLQKYFDVEADDLEAALRVVTERPDADGSGSIVIGASVGGGAALALAARKPKGLVAAVNIAGAVRLTNAQGEVICPYDTPISALARFGAASIPPSLWIYSENDSVFAPDIARRAHAAFRAAGGTADLLIVPAIPPDGHHAFELPNGRVHWLAALDAFLRSRKLTTWQPSQVDTVMRAAGVPGSNRDLVEKYFSLYTPKILLQGGDRRVTYTADTRNLASARDAGLASCEKWAKEKCRVLMENFRMTLP